jgi:hypothetical protein
MENHLLKIIDSLIDHYKEEHKGEPPLYIILSPDENKEVIQRIKNTNDFPDDLIVTSYKGIKLAQHPSLLNGKMYVSNELPETGS